MSVGPKGVDVNIPASGSFEGPPPGAPHEIAQPLSDGLIAEQLAKAQANERSLKPLNFDKPEGSTPAPAVVLTDGPTPEQQNRLNEAARLIAEQRRARGEGEPHQPAASDTDSPSRGMPRPVEDPGKQITGGFGHVHSAYYPLNGEELKELVLAQMDELVARIQTDLRFHIALTYPRVTAKVTIQVHGWAEEGKFQVEKVSREDPKRPMVPEEIAATLGDQVAFLLVAERRETAPDGTHENPPDRVRDELGLKKPMKQSVNSGAMKTIVDVPAASDPNAF